MRLYYIQTLTIFLFLLTLPTITSAQSQKLQNAWNKLEQTEFFKFLDDFKETAYQVANTFKEEAIDTDNAYVISNYTTLREKYNETVIYRIKEDLMNREIRNIMINHSDIYAKSIFADIHFIQKKESANFVAAVRDSFGGETVGAGPLVIAVGIVFSVAIHKAFKTLKGVEKDLRGIDEEFLNSVLIEKYQLTTWEEIPRN